MTRIPEPFAITLYRRFLGGETVQELAESLAIPEERVDRRIRAAAMYSERMKLGSELGELNSYLKRA